MKESVFQRTMCIFLTSRQKHAKTEVMGLTPARDRTLTNRDCCACSKLKECVCKHQPSKYVDEDLYRAFDSSIVM